MPAEMHGNKNKKQHIGAWDRIYKVNKLMPAFSFIIIESSNVFSPKLVLIHYQWDHLE